MPQVRIGISGWTFPAWRGTFYPKGLVQKRELEFASRALTSIEVNGTFYSLQKPDTFRAWRDQTPADFMFAVKAPQYITHIRRLKECEEPLANFFASGLLTLGRKLGPILWQFPPNVTWKDDRFEKFLKLLPTDSKSASKLAKQHGKKVEGRSVIKADESFVVRHAMEFRHPSFAVPEFRALLKAHGVAYVASHASEKSVYLDEPTADFQYLRLHGEGEKFKKGYRPTDLKAFATQVLDWAQRRDVFVYFSTEAKQYSPAGAQSLSTLLQVKPLR